MVGGSVSWRIMQSLKIGSKVAWDAWEQGGYELTTG